MGGRWRFREDVGEVSKRIDVVQLAGFNQCWNALARNDGNRVASICPFFQRYRHVNAKPGANMHKVVEPAILYAGPVVLISTLNQDDSTNLSPMSSAWWLGWSCMLGLDATSKTMENLRRTRECVLNLASADMVEAVDRLALLTGSNPLPLHKKSLVPGIRAE
jgi:Flavin reductase like domain